MRYTGLLVAVVIASAMSGQARADKVGVTVQAAATVRDISSSKARLIVANTEIFENDRLKANSSGNAQIELVDGTKVVIGPNADVKIDDFVYSGGPTLKKLTLSATRGAFRFITGRSSHAAYAVNTPYGTIGVRGTAFDVSVSGGATHIALLNGGLRVCDRTGHCKEIRNPCEYIVVGRHGFQTDKKLNRQMQRARTRRLFPLLADQSGLRPDFRRTARSCSATVEPVQPQFATVVPAIAPPTAPPTNPPSTPPSTPPATGPGNPGNGKGVGGAGEQPGNGGFGDNGTTGKGGGGRGGGGDPGRSGDAPGQNR